MSNNTQKEIILAQEQSVVSKRSDGGQSIQGTLILTNKRLVFAAANEEQDLDIGTGWEAGAQAHLRFADVDDLNSIPPDPSNFSVPLQSIESEEGHKGTFELPKLKIKWREGSTEKSVEFSEEEIGKRKKNLSDWASVIKNLRTGRIKPNPPSSPPPGIDSLGGKILQVLGDMQEKGTLQIEQEVERAFRIELDPDEVETECNKLVSSGYLHLVDSPGGDAFYRKLSPLGQDDLSS